MSVIGSRSAGVEEVIHGVVVNDPYRWLEDRGLPETEEWIQEQRRCCDMYFAECEHLHEIRRRVRGYLDIEVVDQPAKVGNQYFYRRRASGQEQGSIYVREATTGTERLLVDPSADGRFISVGIHRISPNGAMLAYERKCGGEDKKSIHILDVASGTDIDCGIKLGYSRGFVFSVDGSGFYYCQELLDATAEQTINFCRFDRSVPETVIFRVTRSRESRLLLIADSIHLGAIWLREVDGEMLKDFWMTQLKDRNHYWQPVFSEKPLSFKPILKAGRLFAVSYEDNENGKLVEFNKDREEIRTIIPEQELMLRQSLITEDRAFAVLQTSFNSSVQCWDHQGNKLPEMDFPPDGTVGFVPHLGDDGTIFLSYQSFAQPPVIFEFVSRYGLLQVWDKGQSCEAIRPTKIWRAAFRSVDGTHIPITLVGRELACDPKVPRPVIMTSYGGFGVSVTPQFSVLVTLLLECGVLLALPHIRGGGEFGAAWHKAATGRNRQVAFNDFLAAGDWLCRTRITTPTQLAIFGGSNSGLLVGAAMTQRPDLFRAVLCMAPLLDMVRYECFDGASKWRTEYGSRDNEEEFDALYAYSPYHRVTNSAKYPAVLFVTGDKDDRCDPAHVRKMAARLLENGMKVAPVLIDYSPDRGHSPVLPLEIRIEALALRVAFLCRELDLEITSGDGHETSRA